MPRLPWFRGVFGTAMEAENRTVCEVVHAELLSRAFSLSVDCHSGFGTRDRLWFPYAHTRTPIVHLAEMHALKNIFTASHSHYRYIFEPQSLQYLAHGDLWDHLYQQACAQPERIFLPLTLEMGSWLWVKKNPRQLFSRHGIFNPLIAHRQQRVLRQHHPVTRANVPRQLLAAARYRAPLTLATPTLLLASAQDQLVSVACSQALARYWQCALQIHPTAGHDLPLDDGDWVARQIATAYMLFN